MGDSDGESWRNVKMWKLGNVEIEQPGKKCESVEIRRCENETAGIQIRKCGNETAGKVLIK